MVESKEPAAFQAPPTPTPSIDPYTAMGGRHPTPFISAIEPPVDTLTTKELGPEWSKHNAGNVRKCL